MSGSAAKKFLEVFDMYNNGFCGGNMCWIIILILLFCCCGNGNNGGYDCDNGCRC